MNPIKTYMVLGLSSNATKQEIQQAYRRLALKYHPDKHTNSPQKLKDDATQKFKEATEAHEDLMNPSNHRHSQQTYHYYQHQQYNDPKIKTDQKANQYHYKDTLNRMALCSSLMIPVIAGTFLGYLAPEERKKKHSAGMADE